MSDLYHPGVADGFIRNVFATMVRAGWHMFQVLTKRSERLEQISRSLPWRANIWQGVSVEDERVIDRIDHLRAVPARVRFLSLEPLIGPLDHLDLSGIHWVIVGGESGPGARPMNSEWVRSMRKQCRRQHVPFFFKQWGGVRELAIGRFL
jgi:protein gp37